MMNRILTAVAVVLLVAPVVTMADDKKPEMDSATAAMMAEWAKYSTPAEQHKQIGKFAGKWTYKSTMWMDPSQPATATATVSDGTVDVSSLFDGRFYRFHYKGVFMEMPWEGIATIGYDLYKKAYLSNWFDNMGTMMIFSTGTANPTGTEITFTGAFDDPMVKATKSYREVIKWTDGDTWVMEWHESIPGQPESKTMEIVHTRAK